MTQGTFLASPTLSRNIGTIKSQGPLSLTASPAIFSMLQGPGRPLRPRPRVAPAPVSGDGRSRGPPGPTPQRGREGERLLANPKTGELEVFKITILR